MSEFLAIFQDVEGTSAGLQKALLCLTQDWADKLGEVAVDGKALRRSFEDASETRRRTCCRCSRRSRS